VKQGGNVSSDIEVLLARLDEQVKALAARVASLESIIRWLALAIGGALVSAVLNLVLRG
jgi:hypothetical protein